VYVSGNVNVWDTARLLEGGRVIPLMRHEPSLIDFSQIDSKVFIVVAATAYSFFEHFYNKDHHYGVVRVQTALERFGNTSLTLNQDLYDVNSGTRLCQLVKSLVLTDRQTHKPCKIPDNMVEKFGGLCRHEHPPLRIPVVDVNELSAYTSLLFSPSFDDTDFYLHSNQSVYIRWCLDAATEASMKNRLNSILGDLATFRIEKISAVYKVESEPRQQLLIRTWQHQENPWIIYSSVFNADILVYHQATQLCPNSNLLKTV
jgi:acyl-CoA thioesterase FadM